MPIDRAPRFVLNVGGNSKTTPIPTHYDNWTQHLLDIDPAGAPDIVCDARKLGTFDGRKYDSVYCSHNLEHYHHHDARLVLAGFMHVLNDDGFADIRVPDIQEVMKACIERNLDLDDVLYSAPAGPILVRDVLWGYGPQIEESGNDFFAHKTGFSPKSLTAFLQQAGFGEIFIGASAPERYEIIALAFKRPGPNPHKALFGLP